MRGKNILWLSLITMLLATMLTVNVGMAPVGNTKLYIAPDIIPTHPSDFGHPGDIYDMAVKIENVENLWSVGFIVQFAPYARPLVASEVFEGSFLAQGGYMTSFTYKINVLKGQLKIGITRLVTYGLPIQGASGDGVLATFKFAVVEAGDSDIEFTEVSLLEIIPISEWEYILEPLPFSTTGGYYHGVTANLVGGELGKRSESPIEVTNEQVGNEEYVTVTGESVGTEEWISVTGESVGTEEWAFATNETLGVGGHGQKTFYLPNPPVIEGTETIYVDGVPQTSDQYTIDYEAGEITFAKAPAKNTLITADYAYDGQYVFNLAGTPVHEGTEVIYVDCVYQTSDKYTMDYEAGEITFTYLLSNGSVVTADYMYDGQLTFSLGSPVIPGTETIYVDGVPQTSDQYTIDNFAAEITFTYYPENGAVITADYTDGQFVFSLKHAPLWKGVLTVYVDGVVQEKGVDYNVDPGSGVISFTCFPDDGAVVTADYMYSPTKYFTGKVKNTGDVPLFVRVRFDVKREHDGKRLTLYSGQRYLKGWKGEPPVTYLYADGYYEYIEGGWTNPGMSLVGEPDGNVIMGDTPCTITSMYTMEDIGTFGPNDVVEYVSFEAYTMFPAANEAMDLDPYVFTSKTGWGWADSIGGIGEWKWNKGKYGPEGYYLMGYVPDIVTEEGLNTAEVLLHYFGGTAGQEYFIDSIRLKVVFAATDPAVPETYVLEPGEETKLPALSWLLTEAHIGTYTVTTTLEYSFFGALWTEGAKTQKNSWWLSD